MNDFPIGTRILNIGDNAKWRGAYGTVIAPSEMLEEWPPQATHADVCIKYDRPITEYKRCWSSYAAGLQVIGRRQRGITPPRAIPVRKRLARRGITKMEKVK